MYILRLNYTVTSIAVFFVNMLSVYLNQDVLIQTETETF